MDWLPGVNSALEYIEENLAGDIEYKEIAARAGCSIYLFQL
jgi:AraC family transcriptional regulator